MSTFIKFLGWDKFRLERNETVQHVIEISHCHYAVCFSDSSRPKLFTSNDQLFLSRLIKRPNDSAIFAKVSIIDFDEYRDIATAQDIAILPWKQRWPYMLRVQEPSFIKGRLENCILMSRLIDYHGVNSFVTSKKRYDDGELSYNPRLSLAQQSDIELTAEASNWLNLEFKKKTDWLGSISDDYINNLPRPENDL